MTTRTSSAVALAIVTVLLAGFLVARHEWSGHRGPKLDPKYHQTMTVAPDPAEAGSQLRVSFARARQVGDELTFERWDGDGFGPEYLLTQGRFSKLGPQGALVLFPGSPVAVSAVSTLLPADIRPGRYRVCDLKKDACALLTVSG